MGDHPLNPFNWNAQQLGACIIFLLIVAGLVAQLWSKGNDK